MDHEKGWFGSPFQQDLADLEHTLKYLGLDAKQVMVSGVTACLEVWDLFSSLTWDSSGKFLIALGCL